MAGGGGTLQKNYLSVYLPEAVLDPYRGRMEDIRMRQGNFNFVRFGDLRVEMVAETLGQVVGSVSHVKCWIIY